MQSSSLGGSSIAKQWVAYKPQTAARNVFNVKSPPKRSLFSVAIYLMGMSHQVNNIDFFGVLRGNQAFM